MLFFQFDLTNIQYTIAFNIRIKTKQQWLIFSRRMPLCLS